MQQAKRRKDKERHISGKGCTVSGMWEVLAKRLSFVACTLLLSLFHVPDTHQMHQHTLTRPKFYPSLYPQAPCSGCLPVSPAGAAAAVPASPSSPLLSPPNQHAPFVLLALPPPPSPPPVRPNNTRYHRQCLRPRSFPLFPERESQVYELCKEIGEGGREGRLDTSRHHHR